MKRKNKIKFTINDLNIYSNLLSDITDTFNLSFLHSTNPIPTRYLDNSNDLNSVIDLIFLRSNSLELNNHLILPDLQYLSDHAPLVVNIHISEEFMQDDRYTIIKNSKKEIKFICEVIENIKKIDILHLINKEFARILNCMW